MVKIDMIRLRRALREAKIKQKDVAEKAGVSVSVVSRTLKGRRAFKLELYAVMCRLLGVGMETFIEWEGSPGRRTDR